MGSATEAPSASASQEGKSKKKEKGLKKGSDAAAATASFADAIKADPKEYVSPIAKPRIEGKLLERGVKLLRKAAACETAARANGAALKASDRPIKRGVAEVTRFIRKGGKGVVVMATDVFPVDILAPLPVYCEKNAVPYGFLGNKKVLGGAIKSNRLASVVLVAYPVGDAGAAYKETYDKFFKELKELSQV